jgi:hypothetical protein
MHERSNSQGVPGTVANRRPTALGTVCGSRPGNRHE